MIRFFLLQNKQGKTRLSKWYATAPIESERVRLEAEVHNIVSLRAKGNTNFVEVLPFFYREIILYNFQHNSFGIKSLYLHHIIPSQYRSFKLIYRRYAGLYFVFGVDTTDNELLLMETIHLFVELLDEYFSDVCEVVNHDSDQFFENIYLNLAIISLSTAGYSVSL